MATFNIIRAWKDDDYRLSLSDEQRALLPENPAGALELTDDELSGIVGGYSVVEPGTGTGTGSGEGCYCYCQC